MLNNWFFALFMSHRWSEQVKQCNGIRHTLVVESAELSSGLCGEGKCCAELSSGLCGGRRCCLQEDEMPTGSCKLEIQVSRRVDFALLVWCGVVSM